ncbi:Stage III sporulation protein E [Planctomycetales bacterium 10988]|nr:Stage III sporulation protein E [Planctomycetales bacterium 10988]
MTVSLPVREISGEIYRVAKQAGDGRPSTMFLGQIFHEVFAELTSSCSDRNFQSALIDADPTLEDWQSKLRHHLYQKLVGPRLRRHHNALQESSEQVIDFWSAVKDLGDWFADVLFSAYEKSKSSNTEAFLQGIAEGIDSEEPLSWELRQPDWTDSVRVHGIADCIWRIPQSEKWCLVEFKLGKTSPESDLAQVCLYHHLLENQTGKAGPLALMSFKPTKTEQFFSVEQLKEVQNSLIALIGSVAGVLPTATPDPLPKPKPSSSESISQLGKKLLAALEEYGAPCSLSGDPIVGPTFIRFPLIMGTKVKYSTLTKHVKEFQFRLGLDEPPIIGASSGRVVIDVQRPKRDTVLFTDLEADLKKKETSFGSSNILLGVDLEGRLHFADLAEPENAHMLVAGTTGSGKTEWIRSAIASLLLLNTPETLKLILIDPKRNAFHELKGSPFLDNENSIVYPDEQPVAEVLEMLVEEMEERYRMIEGYDHLAEYVQDTGNKIPRIICICDEYMDLMLQDSAQRKELERLISRLGAKARAAGIHLILATQRPDKKTVTGHISTNLPARVGLKLDGGIESRMIIDANGAENLLGRGDLLFKSIGPPKRLQSPYLPPEARNSLFKAKVSIPVK